MRIELYTTGPDGTPNWIEIRDKIKGGDIYAVHDASEVPVDPVTGQTTTISYQKLDDAQFNALFQRLVTGWSFQVPLPGSVAAAKSVLSDLDGDDWNKVRAEMDPLLKKVKSGELPDPKTPSTGSPSGSSTEA